jgi:ribonucleotide reductase alpha subunit
LSRSPADKDPQPVKNVYEHAPPFACYILSVDDKLVGHNSIMDLWEREARLFKRGAGVGVNPSTLRGRNEPLSSGGKSSGLMSWLKIGDEAAGSIKSGGSTRRAALMRCLDVDHPDIISFIDWKAREEQKVRALVEGHNLLMNEDAEYEHLAEAMNIDLAYDFNNEAYETVSGQNSNNSVRVTEAFMQAVYNDDSWATRARTGGEIVAGYNAREIWDRIAHAAWLCADPGVQFDTTINDWHTVPQEGRINASNPCFTGDTLVDTPEGRIRIDTLAEADAQGKPLPRVFAFDRASDLPVLSEIEKAWCTRHVDQLVEVVTDKGIILRCTPNHEFLLKDGTYCRADELKSGTRLRKIGRSVNEKRSNRRYLNHRATEDCQSGTRFQARWMYEQLYGPVPEGYEVHHANDDATDDRGSNFVLVDTIGHRKLHGEGPRNPNSVEVTEQALVETLEAVEQEFDEVTISRWNRYIRRNGLVGEVPLAKYTSRAIRGMSWDQFREWVDARRSLVNDQVHAVRSIHLDEPVPVYDLRVRGTHNFAVTNETDTGRHTLVVSNCSEYLSIDNSACNLASINLNPFYCVSSGHFNIEGYEQACRFWTVVLDVSVSMGSTPSPEVAYNTYRLRNLGLGYANLGALLMRMGLPYDSDEGRKIAASLTAILTGQSYATSAEMAGNPHLGPFPAYRDNAQDMARVIRNHARAAGTLHSDYEQLSVNPFAISDWNPEGDWRSGVGKALHDHARLVWDCAVRTGRQAVLTCRDLAPAVYNCLLHCPGRVDTKPVHFADSAFRGKSVAGLFPLS